MTNEQMASIVNELAQQGGKESARIIDHIIDSLCLRPYVLNLQGEQLCSGELRGGLANYRHIHYPAIIGEIASLADASVVAELIRRAPPCMNDRIILTAWDSRLRESGVSVGDCDIEPYLKVTREQIAQMPA